MISNKTNQAMINEILEDFAVSGITRLKETLERLLNELMLSEREDHISAGPHERSPDRKGYSNGFKNKNLPTKSDDSNYES